MHFSVGLKQEIKGRPNYYTMNAYSMNDMMIQKCPYCALTGAYVVVRSNMVIVKLYHVPSLFPNL